MSCLFCLAPALFAGSMMVVDTGAATRSLALPGAAILAGLAYVGHIYFYFRTLYCLNDVSGTETFLSLSVILVPIMAWLLLDETLPGHIYLAFAVAVVGVVLQCLPLFRMAGAGLMLNLILSVVCVSLSMVLQAHALEVHGFITATLTFNLSCFLPAIAYLLICREVRCRLLQTGRQFSLILVATELLDVLAVIASHRAMQLGPSVSLVALIECLLPLMIIIFSFLLIRIHRLRPLLSAENLVTLANQIQRVPAKLGVFLLVIIALSSMSVQGIQSESHALQSIYTGVLHETE